jgi:tripartite-type tricarboxylate transporter receptor subunit TctC
LLGTIKNEFADLKLVGHVTFCGSSALTDLPGGQVQVMFDVVPSSIEHIRTGRLRALAVTTALRSEALPNIPTVVDFVPGYEASGRVGAPKNTPAGIIETLNKEINAALADPKIKSRLADLGCCPARGRLRRSYPQRRETRGPSGPSTDQVRIGHQS